MVEGGDLGEVKGWSSLKMMMLHLFRLRSTLQTVWVVMRATQAKGTSCNSPSNKVAKCCTVLALIWEWQEARLRKMKGCDAGAV